MAHHEQQNTDKTEVEIVDRIWELAEKIDVCMFVTWDGERQQACPLSSRVHRDEHAIYFLVSAEGHKNPQIEQFPVVNLSYADTSGMNFISLSGTAEISNDRSKITELWEQVRQGLVGRRNRPRHPSDHRPPRARRALGFTRQAHRLHRHADRRRHRRQARFR